ncbi:MAG: biotin--[acetyl-CoA-carboxylase] ligase [Phycisphaerales bacterium]|nr:biotin--[acetyl-CoA-carboxylase] ligase [Planctomycetota bacterium]MCH8509078.1 biotin--[acetyl-CoA-carboxylase] ligase [Phycisphaerales bacterium]
MTPEPIAPEDITGWTDTIESALPNLPDCCVSRVFVYARTASTQAAAWRHRLPDAGVAVIASEQTAGRGQRGRRWHDGAGSTLPMSFALPTRTPDVALSARAGLAALDACRLHAPPPPVDIRIKWPNDIVARDGSGDRKLAGVLIERRDGVALIGIGINVHQSAPDLDAAGLPDATSLAILGGKTNRLMLAIDLITAMSDWLRADDDAVREHWAAHDAVTGTERAFVIDNERIEGTVTALDPLGMISINGRELPVDRAIADQRKKPRTE